MSIIIKLNTVRLKVRYYLGIWEDIYEVGQSVTVTVGIDGASIVRHKGLRTLEAFPPQGILKCRRSRPETADGGRITFVPEEVDGVVC